MKKDIINVMWGIIAGVMITVAGIIIAVSILIYNADVGEMKRVTEEVNVKLCILEEYGSDAYNAYGEVEKEFEKYGDPGIGTYEFEYWGDTLRINAKSTNGVYSVSRPCR